MTVARRTRRYCAARASCKTGSLLPRHFDNAAVGIVSLDPAASRFGQPGLCPFHRPADRPFARPSRGHYPACRYPRPHGRMAGLTRQPPSLRHEFRIHRPRRPVALGRCADYRVSITRTGRSRPLLVTVLDVSDRRQIEAELSPVLLSCGLARHHPQPIFYREPIPGCSAATWPTRILWHRSP